MFDIDISICFAVMMKCEIAAENKSKREAAQMKSRGTEKMKTCKSSAQRNQSE